MKAILILEGFATLLAVLCGIWFQEALCDSNDDKAKTAYLNNAALSAQHYEFGYRINASEGSNQGHHASRNGSHVRGNYYITFVDGSNQNVEYLADENGYHPSVHFRTTDQRSSLPQYNDERFSSYQNEVYSSSTPYEFSTEKSAPDEPLQETVSQNEVKRETAAPSTVDALSQSYFNSDGATTQRSVVHSEGITSQQNYFDFETDGTHLNLYGSESTTTSLYAFDSERITPRNVFNSESVTPRNDFESESIATRNDLHSESMTPRNDLHSESMTPRNDFYSERVTPSDVFDSESKTPRSDSESVTPRIDSESTAANVKNSDESLQRGNSRLVPELFPLNNLDLENYFRNSGLITNEAIPEFKKLNTSDIFPDNSDYASDIFDPRTNEVSSEFLNKILSAIPSAQENKQVKRKPIIVVQSYNAEKNPDYTDYKAQFSEPYNLTTPDFQNMEMSFDIFNNSSPSVSTSQLLETAPENLISSTASNQVSDTSTSVPEIETEKNLTQYEVVKFSKIERPKDESPKADDSLVDNGHSSNVEVYGSAEIEPQVVKEQSVITTTLEIQKALPLQVGFPAVENLQIPKVYENPIESNFVLSGVPIRPPFVRQQAPIFNHVPLGSNMINFLIHPKILKEEKMLSESIFYAPPRTNFFIPPNAPPRHSSAFFRYATHNLTGLLKPNVYDRGQRKAEFMRFASKPMYPHNKDTPDFKIQPSLSADISFVQHIHPLYQYQLPMRGIPQQPHPFPVPRHGPNQFAVQPPTQEPFPYPFVRGSEEEPNLQPPGQENSPQSGTNAQDHSAQSSSYVPTGVRHEENSVLREQKQSAPFKPSQPLWDSTYPPQHMYYVPVLVTDEREVHSRSVKDVASRRNQRVKQLIIEYGGFKPPMVPSTLLEEYVSTISDSPTETKNS